MIQDGVRYYTSYSGQDLEDLNAYVTDQDAFKLPEPVIGEFESEIGAGGIRTYSQFGTKEINLTLTVLNSADTDSNLRALVALFRKPGDLIMEDRPDRYIHCRLSSGISVKDAPGATELSLKLLSEFPFFLDLSEHEAVDADELIIGGTAPSYPIITLSGITEDPYIQISNSTGTIKKYSSSLSMGASDAITIDCFTNRILMNGGNVAGRWSGCPLFLTPGSNLLQTNAPSLRVKYRNTYL